jgi:hypothetical protein
VREYDPGRLKGEDGDQNVYLVFICLSLSYRLQLAICTISEPSDRGDCISIVANLFLAGFRAQDPFKASAVC